MLEATLLDLLACPADGGRLEQTGNALVCTCGRRFDVIDGVPVLMLEGDRIHGEQPESMAGLLDDPGFRRMVARREHLPEDATGVEWDIAMAGGFTTFDRLCRLEEYPIPVLDLPALGGVLVDVGSNWGRWAFAAQRAAYTVLAIDTQLPACLVGQRIAARLALPVQFIVADARRLPLRAEGARVVHSYNVFQYLSESDAERAIAEMRRVLEPGGLAVAQVPGRYGIGSMLHQLRRGFRTPSGAEVRYWRPGRLRSLFSTGLGPTRLEMDGFIGLNPRHTSAHALPVRARLGVALSRMLRPASGGLPLLTWVSDSLRVISRKEERDSTSAPARLARPASLRFAPVRTPRTHELNRSLFYRGARMSLDVVRAATYAMIVRRSRGASATSSMPAVEPSSTTPAAVRLGTLRRVSDYSIEWAEPGYCLVSRGRYLYQAAAPDASPKWLLEFPASALMRAASARRTSQRLLRALFYNVLRLPSGDLLLTFGREIALFRRGRFHALQGLVHTTRLLRGACAVLPNGDVFFGDYLRGPRPTCARIYRLPAESTRLEVVHEFDAGEILHIHGVHYDPYDDALWAVTGDWRLENRILRSRDGFATMEVIGQGDESWRCIALRFTADSVYYGTDAEYAQNQLYRLDRRSRARQPLCHLDGPVYYSSAVGSHLFWGVAAEMCPSQRERRGSLWCMHDDQLARVRSFEKDSLPWRLFMPGTVEFPLGPGIPGSLLLRGTGFRGFDGPTYAMDVASDSASAATLTPERAHRAFGARAH